MWSHRRIICQARSRTDAWMIRCQSRVADAVGPELENGMVISPTIGARSPAADRVENGSAFSLASVIAGLRSGC
jgi:hypothetical protein